jgi:hypothetical protein
MSTATRSPETYELESDDALNALRRRDQGRLAKYSFQRFRTAHTACGTHGQRRRLPDIGSPQAR